MKQKTDTIGYLIVQICKAHRQRAENALNELGLHVGQEMVLFQLWREDGVTQSELIEQLCIEPPTMTKMLQRIEKAGFVQRQQDSQDARVSRVYLTETGRALEQPVTQIWQNLDELSLSGLSVIEQALLIRLMMQLRDNLA